MRQENKALRESWAHGALRACNIPLGANFHTLSSFQVCNLLSWADILRYRKPRDASGSRARYFHALMQRRAAKYIPPTPPAEHLASIRATLAPILDESGQSAGFNTVEWSGSPCPIDPDNYWIDDETGERIKAERDQ